MKLRVDVEGGLYYLWVEEGGGSRRPLLLPGDAPSWAGGWAGCDGLGGYERRDALRVLGSLGLSDDLAARLLEGVGIKSARI